MNGNILYSVGVIAILVFIFICLISFIFSKGDKHEISKFIGGFAVLLISLYAQSEWVYVVAIFITGLIIASERFMSMLVALIKGDEDFLASENFIKMMQTMSGKEIKEKVESEIEEIEAVKSTNIKKQRKTVNNTTLLNTKKKIEDIKIQDANYIETISNIENSALDKYEKLTNLDIRRNVKIGNLMLDGIGINPRDKFALYIFEVITFRQIDRSWSKEQICEYVIRKLRFMLPHRLLRIMNDLQKSFPKLNNHFILTVISVVDTNKDLELLQDAYREFKKEFNSSNSIVTTRYVTFNLPKLS